jgi:hypothetical protein
MEHKAPTGQVRPVITKSIGDGAKRRRNSRLLSSPAEFKELQRMKRLEDFTITLASAPTGRRGLCWHSLPWRRLWREEGDVLHFIYIVRPPSHTPT